MASADLSASPVVEKNPDVEKNGVPPPQHPEGHRENSDVESSGRILLPRCLASPHEQPLVAPQVVHFMQVPLRTSVKLPQSLQESPS